MPISPADLAQLKMESYELPIHAETCRWYNSPLQVSPRLLEVTRNAVYQIGTVEELHLIEALERRYPIMWHPSHNQLISILTLQPLYRKGLTLEQNLYMGFGEQFRSKPPINLNSVYSTTSIYTDILGRINRSSPEFDRLITTNISGEIQHHGIYLLTPPSKTTPRFMRILSEYRDFLKAHGAQLVRISTLCVFVGLGIYGFSGRNSLIDEVRSKISDSFQTPESLVIGAFSLAWDFVEPIPLALFRGWVLG